MRSWPDAGILLSSDGLVGLSHGNWGDQDRRWLREAGVSARDGAVPGRRVSEKQVQREKALREDTVVSPPAW